MKFFNRWKYPLFYALGVFGFPLSATLPVLLQTDSRPISLVLRATVLALSLIMLLSFKAKIIKRDYFIFLILFWTLYTLRVIVAASDGVIVSFFTNDEFLAFAYGTCFLPMLATMSLTDYTFDASSRILTTVYYIVFLASAINLFLTSSIETVSGRASTEVLNAISFGHTGASLTILSYLRLLKYGFFKKKITYFILALVNSLGIIIGISATLASASKGPLVALVICFFVLVSVKISLRTFVSILIYLLLILAASSLILSYLKLNYGIEPLERFMSGVEGDESSLGRVESFSGAINQFLDNPIFGSEIVEAKTGWYPHNVILESFMATGIVGGTIFTCIFLLSILRSYSLVKNSSSFVWIGLLGIQYAINVLFSGSLFTSGQFWMTIALVFTVSKYSKQS